MDQGHFKPKPISREYVFNTINYDGMNLWRNPVRIDEVRNGWPRPSSERARGYERILGMEKSITGKSPD
jgi:hypothetical protein